MASSRSPFSQATVWLRPQVPNIALQVDSPTETWGVRRSDWKSFMDLVTKQALDEPTSNYNGGLLPTNQF